MFIGGVFIQTPVRIAICNYANNGLDAALYHYVQFRLHHRHSLVVHESSREPKATDVIINEHYRVQLNQMNALQYEYEYIKIHTVVTSITITYEYD